MIKYFALFFIVNSIFISFAQTDTVTVAMHEKCDLIYCERTEIIKPSCNKYYWKSDSSFFNGVLIINNVSLRSEQDTLSYSQWSLEIKNGVSIYSKYEHFNFYQTETFRELGLRCKRDKRIKTDSSYTAIRYFENGFIRHISEKWDYDSVKKDYNKISIRHYNREGTLLSERNSLGHKKHGRYFRYSEYDCTTITAWYNQGQIIDIEGDRIFYFSKRKKLITKNDFIKQANEEKLVLWNYGIIRPEDHDISDESIQVVYIGQVILKKEWERHFPRMMKQIKKNLD